MQVRQEIFDTYWRFAAQRQEVFFKRIKNLPPPWTSDPIINEYKFCNAYRASDRVSQYLIKNIINQGNQNEEEVLFRILLFKTFNKIETWQYLESRLGTIQVSGFDFDVYSNLLQSAIDAGQVIYTSAYMSCPTKEFGYEKKHQNHLALLCKMVKQDRIVNKIVKAKSLEEVFSILFAYPLIGNFMAYQLATDINYSEIIDFDENTFTIAGPGAARGIAKCFIDTGGKSNAEIIDWMTENQESQFQRLGINFCSLWGRPLKAIDCQNIFCELDKYCRVAVPELKSNRKKIRIRFSANSQPIDYYYPPKWGINDKVNETLAQRLPTPYPSLALGGQESVRGKAVIDPTGLYRYLLWREWNPELPRVAFVMLNPSTADDLKNDRTLDKCERLAKFWSYGSLEVVNLFAYRATQPEDLHQAADPVGPENEHYLKEVTERAEMIIVAWGKEGSWLNQDQAVLRLIADYNNLYCLELTKDRHPRHPLYVKNNTTPVPFPVPPLQLVLNLGI